MSSSKCVCRSQSLVCPLRKGSHEQAWLAASRNDGIACQNRALMVLAAWLRPSRPSPLQDQSQQEVQLALVCRVIAGHPVLKCLIQQLRPRSHSVVCHLVCLLNLLQDRLRIITHLRRTRASLNTLIQCNVRFSGPQIAAIRLCDDCLNAI